MVHPGSSTTRWFSLVTLAAVACGPRVAVSPLNPSPRPLVARPVATVEIFTTSAPGSPYVEVALLQASDGQADQHLEALRVEAANIGCDGLIVTHAATQSTSEDAFGLGSSKSVTGGSTATCVMFR